MKLIHFMNIPDKDINFTCKKEVFLIFPPFPGLNSNNEFLAKSIFNKTGCDVIYINYTGLSANASEKFDFMQSVKESLLINSYFVGAYDKVHLIGHSWGGLIAINCFKQISEEKRGMMILLAPFTIFPKDGSIEKWLIPMAASQDNFHFSHTDPELVKNNFYEVEQYFDPTTQISCLNISDNQITIIEALDDTDVSAESILNLFKAFESSAIVQRIILSDDHNFNQNYNMLIDCVLKSINYYVAK